ncbi:MAG: hypothetical protein OER43_19500, partial [Gammaproteobacteria bacterium]|nr:hypothetical protein [Gammaproteobacteria bacterium]
DQDAIAVGDDEFQRDDTPPQNEDSALVVANEEIEAVGSDSATVESVDEDPLSELNIYMAYEHFDQAEDLVRRAIADNPDRHDYRLKLLEVFYAAKNVPAFQQAAAELRDAVGADSPHISTAIGWWEDLAPGQDLFGAAQLQSSETVSSSTAVDNSADEVFDVTSGTGDNEESAVDFDLGFEMTGAGEEKEDSQESSVDFELDSGESEEAIPAGAESNPDVEFDLSELDGDTAAESEVARSGDLEFDTQRNGGAAVAKAEGGGLNFDLAEDQGDAGQDDLADSAFDMDLDLGTGSDGEFNAETPKETLGLDFDFDVTQGYAAGSGDGSGGLDLQSFDEPETSAEADGDLTAADERLDKNADNESEPRAASDFSSEDDELSLDFDIGENLDAENGASDDLDLAIGMESDDARENSGLDFSIEGGTDEELSFSSAGRVGAGSDVDFEIGGDDDGQQKIGIDTVFDGVFDESDEDASGDRGGSDDDPLGIGGGSSELPKLDTDTEDAIDLTFLGNPGGTDSDDILADLEFGDENTSDGGDDSDRTEYMLRDVPKPHAGDTDVASAAASGDGSSELDDIQTKLDLAEAYIEMGDTDGARGILGEVMSEGSQNQQDQAKDLLQKLG